jgi:transcriptional regulator with XRE-family HTH domain
VASLGDVIANNVRAERARRHWTQARLADQIGWPRTAVHEVESGRRRLGPDDLAALCRVFGIPLAELARGANPDDLAALGIGPA